MCWPICLWRADTAVPMHGAGIENGGGGGMRAKAPVSAQIPVWQRRCVWPGGSAINYILMWKVYFRFFTPNSNEWGPLKEGWWQLGVRPTAIKAIRP
jgi:hypothetical protein